MTKQEKLYLDSMKNMDPITNEEKLWDYAQRLVRRNECSQHTLTNIRRLSMRKLVRLFIIGYKMMNPIEWKQFSGIMYELSDKKLKLVNLMLKIPFGQKRCIQKEALGALREAV